MLDVHVAVAADDPQDTPLPHGTAESFGQPDEPKRIAAGAAPEAEP